VRANDLQMIDNRAQLQSGDRQFKAVYMRGSK